MAALAPVRDGAWLRLVGAAFIAFDAAGGVGARFGAGARCGTGEDFEDCELLVVFSMIFGLGSKDCQSSVQINWLWFTRVRGQTCQVCAHICWHTKTDGAHLTGFHQLLLLRHSSQNLAAVRVEIERARIEQHLVNRAAIDIDQAGCLHQVRAACRA